MPSTDARANVSAQADAAIELLEAIAADRGLLAWIPEQDRTRLLIAAGRVSRPDPAARRRLARIMRRKRRDELRQADEDARARTGIRAASGSRTLPGRATPRALSAGEPSVFAPGAIRAGVSGGRTVEAAGERTPGVSGGRTPGVSSGRTPGVSGGRTPGLSGGRTVGGSNERSPGASGERVPDESNERSPGASGERVSDGSSERSPGAFGERSAGEAGERSPGGFGESAPGAPQELNEPRKCYICKREYRLLHGFYDALCPPCAELNWAKRHQRPDLTGRVAVVTGARVKIGYNAALMLLRAGARVVVTTRFPRDAAVRYAREPDFDEWADRVEIYGLELRHTPSVEALCEHLDARLPRLDFLLNNACQTVRRPPGFYAHLLAREAAPARELPAPERALLERYEALRGAAGATEHAPGRLVPAVGDARADGIARAADYSQLELLPEDRERGEHLFPTGALDGDLQQVDLRRDNSWRLQLADVPTIELLEVHLVNAVAPFVLAAKLKPVMLRMPSRDKHIVNVSAMEGQFYRSFKTDRHPHTNMAKAALNMLTRTSAADYITDGIHMNSVDTGWITDEDPAHVAARKTFEHGFHPPLDAVDGAARICDPIFSGFLTGEHVWGMFLKDYRPTEW